MTPEEMRTRWPESESCVCETCISYCQRPGWFLSDEVRLVAEFLGLTLKECFERYLVVDWYGDPSDGIPLLAPGKVDEHGSVASVEFPYSVGDCIFLKDERCTIHPVKPHECRMAHHLHTRDSVAGIREQVAKVWAEEEGRTLIREVGYDPDLFEVPLPAGFEEYLAKVLGFGRVV